MLSSAKEQNQDNLLLADISEGGDLHPEGIETIGHIVEGHIQDPLLLITEGEDAHPKETGGIVIVITKKVKGVIVPDLDRKNTGGEDKADLIQ